MKTEIVYERPVQEQAITIEHYLQRREQRRKRVARRLFQKRPLFAVEEMKSEFLNYTTDMFQADIVRPRKYVKKKMRGKSFRFDWNFIRSENPVFFQKCIIRTPTTAVIRMKVKDYHLRVTIRSMYDDGQKKTKLDTFQLLRLLQGPIGNLLRHPAVITQQEINDL